MIRLKSPAMISKMKQSGLLVHKFHEQALKISKPGITTFAYEELAIDFTKEHGFLASFHKYNGYPAHVCVSVNEEIIHGIPSRKKILNDGDLVSVDFGAYFQGFHGDSAISFIVGDFKKSRSGNVLKLLEVTQKALELGLNEVKPGNTIGDIGFAIQNFVESNGFGVVRDFVGHGIGETLHEEPQVPNFGTKGIGLKLKKGMTLAIEPMVVEGSPAVKVLKDNWTAVTKDNKLACHCEHTVVVTDKGYEILTKP